MKFHLNFAFWVVAANCQRPTLPQLPADVPLGNLLSAFTAAYNNLTKTIDQATADYKNGTPLAIVFDNTLPKILPEAKLHKRTIIKPEKPIREGSVTAKAAFGPYVLVGRNVRAQQKIVLLL
jgi:hypothetical protein